jgi:hypothetical protein
MLRRLLYLSIALLCLAGTLLAGEAKFQLFKTYVKLPEVPALESYTLVTDYHQITFIPPKDGILQTDPQKSEIQISFKDNHCTIKLQLSGISPSLAAPNSWEQLRAIVQSRYADGEVSPGAACYNSSAPGCSFNIQRTTVYKTKLVTFLAFVPFPGSMMEVSMSATPANAAAQQLTVQSLLNSFRFEKPNPATISFRKEKE